MSVKKKKRKPPKKEVTHDWVIPRMPWSVGKPTYIFLLEAVPAAYDDVVRLGDTRGFVSKRELFEFTEANLGLFAWKDLPDGMMWRGRTFIASVAPTGERDAKEDVSCASTDKRNDTGSGGSSDEEIRTPN
ncbi:MAG: hypothetical protein ACREBU_12080 [Nitrososphaera sp.]